MTDMFDLSGRVALVSGAAGSLGKATSLALAEAGADLAPVHGPGGQRADHDEQHHEEVVPPARSSVDAE